MHCDNCDNLWSCTDIEKVFKDIYVGVQCKIWTIERSVFIELKVTDKESYKMIYVDTAKVKPEKYFYSRSKSAKEEVKYAPVDYEYAIEFRKEKSSVIDLYSSAEDLQEQLNKEIPAFEGNLVVSSYSNSDVSYLYFMLPGSMFKEDVQFIRLQKLVEGKVKDEETLDIVKKPGDSKFWWIIPSDFLRTFEKKTQVRVSVDGSYAVCTRGCGFFYLPTHYISSFSVDKNVLTLVKDEKIPQDDLQLIITVGEAPCEIEYIHPEEYKCCLLYTSPSPRDS